ncbi:hypothetical protein BMJ32_28685 [Sinorhizobium medicae]|uniref:Uncharacterized protein n=1 Tax=Sinorhizobium medicae TaxID=110321 RepID=A0ABX4TEZ9_9HYPH|nr:hypothetical protein BMJ32_28685 [Sinorhizobium medicae]PLT96891.1 hypothetical protein BMJ33_26990 [Sinorhizobium medicae]PLU19747.1 hypothetical protein BMJ30_10395 [Sinorhizobium medicae]PLU20742.1 hypothetical protein BMJ29_13070 [Sinorhizobium medicae]PLU25327.1 hypothetical protein BMJ31_10845 [Sinorhizobium medicae]
MPPGSFPGPGSSTPPATPPQPAVLLTVYAHRLPRVRGQMKSFRRRARRPCQERQIRAGTHPACVGVIMPMLMAGNFLS